MAADIVIPPAIEEVICEFDSASAPLDEHALQQALNAARGSLANPSDAENLGAWAEVLAFALVESRHHSSPWNTYFGPMGSDIKDDGTTVYFPDIAGVDARVVVHWARRAKSIKHPVLKARYADLAWDMSRAIAKTRPEPDMARIAIDSYIVAVIEAGNYRSVAAEAVGIHPDTINQWMRKTRKPYTEFSEAIRQAEALSEQTMVALIQKAAKTEWRAAMEYLSRKHPERWAKREFHGALDSKGEPTDQSFDVLVVPGPLNELEWAEAASRYKKIQPRAEELTDETE